MLAAVLIPTFVNLVKKANVSADTTLIKNLNTALATDGGEHKTMSDALASADEFGFDVTKIQAKATNNKILWDSVNDCFVYFDAEKDKIVYIPDSKEKDVQNHELWAISNIVDETYSTYLVNNDNATVVTTQGLDVTACGSTNVVYNGSLEVSITTNGGNLTVNSGVVNHYGIGNILVVADGAICNQYGIFSAQPDDFTNAGESNSEYVYVNSAEALKKELENKTAKIALSTNIDVDVELSESNLNDFVVSSATEINLHGYNISTVHNSSTGVGKNNGVFYVNADASLTLTGSGEISFITNNQMGWNACTYVIGGKGDIIIDGGIKIANNGGTDMSYAIDISSWGDSVATNVTIKSGYVYSKDYCAIIFNRQGNSSADKTTTFNLVIDGGVVMSENRSPLMVHDGSAASDGIYNITINGGNVGSKGDSKLIKRFQADEKVALTVTNGQVFQNGTDVTNEYK